MEKSQEIFEKLQVLEATRGGVEKRWGLANKAPDLRELVMELNIREKTGPQEEVERLQKEVTEKLKARDAEKDNFLSRWKELRRSLEMITRPAISAFIFQFHELSGTLGKKGVSEIIEKNWDGFKGVGTLRIRTNRPSLEEVREKIKKAIEKIQQMHDCSIPMIEQEVARLEKEIRGIDLSKTIEKTVSEDDYYRFTTPKGVGSDYSGPRTRL